MTVSADLNAFATSPRWPVLFVHHGWGGGIGRHLHDLKWLLDDDCEIVMLEPAIPGTPGPEVRLRWERATVDGRHEIDSLFSLAHADGRARLVAALQALGVIRIHYHHIHALPAEVLQLPRMLDVPYDVTLHDYFALGPHYHLTGGAGHFCGEPEAADFTDAREHGEGHIADGRSFPAFPDWPPTLPAWRALMGDFLSRADRVIAPSHDIADRTHRALPVFTPVVWPHPEATAAAAPRLRVAVLGALSPEKGFDVLLACAQAAEQQNLPLSFRILGTAARPLPTLPMSRLSMSGEYEERDLAALIAAERPDVFFFPAQVPESFCYALTPVLLSGKPVVASMLGALGERLRLVRVATLLPWDSTPDDWNAALLRYLPKAEEQPAALDNREMYRQRYLEVLPAGMRPEHAVSAGLPPVTLGINDASLSLPDLFNAGIDCGRRAAREQLQRRLYEVAPEQIARDVSYRLNDELTRRLTHQITEKLTAQLTPQLTEQLTATITRQVTERYFMLHPIKRRLRNAWLLYRHHGLRALLARIRDKLLGRHSFITLAPTTERWRPIETFQQASAIEPLVLESSPQPRVSILVPAYGEALATYSCLKSIQQHTHGIDYEVLVLDDASPEPLQKALAEVRGVRFIRQNDNLGFLKNCNAGAQYARGDTLVFLNNDTIVTEGWLTALLDTLERVPRAGLVGAQLCYPDGRLQEAGGLVFRDGSAWNYGRNDDPDLPEYRFLRDVDYCSGACIALQRELFVQLGGFDERYAPAYYEDTDLAFAVRAAGLRVLYQPMARIIHFEGQTSGTDETQGVKRHQVINQSVFAEKWSTVLAAYPERIHDPALARATMERSVQARVLVLDSFMLTPDRDSGSLRMQQILELFAQPGQKVTFAATSLEYRAPYVEQLQARGVEVIHYPFARTPEEILKARGSEFDLVVLSRLEVAARCLPVARQHAPQAKVVFDTVDLHFLRAEREAELLGSNALRQRAAEQKTQELALMRAADRTWVVSPAEAELLAPLVPDVKIGVLSNIHAPKPAGLDFAGRAGILFIGSFRHPPNVDAMLWYTQQVLPLVRQLMPGVVTTIIGGDAPASVKSLASDDVVVTGYVEDVEPYFTSARISIAPLRYGAGVKGKVNQAMSYGVPVVATTIAAEGMHLTDGEDVLITDEPQPFAEALVRAYQDSALWQKLSAAGRANIEAHFSPDVAQREIGAALKMAKQIC